MGKAKGHIPLCRNCKRVYRHRFTIHLSSWFHICIGCWESHPDMHIKWRRLAHSGRTRQTSPSKKINITNKSYKPRESPTEGVM